MPHELAESPASFGISDPPTGASMVSIPSPATTTTNGGPCGAQRVPSNDHRSLAIAVRRCHQLGLILARIIYNLEPDVFDLLTRNTPSYI